MEKENKSKFWKGVLVGALVTAFAGLIIVGVATGISVIGRTVIDNQAETQTVSNAGEEPQTEGLNLNRIGNKLKLLQSVVEQRYLYDENPEDVETGIYKGMMYSLGDPYADYYDAEEYKKLSETTEGTYCGIGVLVTQNPDNGQVVVVRVFPDTPGEEAGMLPGDIITRIDDVEVGSMSLDLLVSQHIRGVEGTVVRITVKRDEKSVELKVIRRQVETPTVSSKILNGNTGYIMISQFEMTTAGQFAKAVEQMQQEGMERLVIDLRGNPGGVLDGAVDIAAYLLPEQPFDGMLLYTENRDKKGERYYCKNGQIYADSDLWNGKNTRYPKKDGHQLDLPIAVLIDGNTASASEALTGALKDYQWATVVGTTSYGKGIVQNVIPLTDGSAVKLTVESYFTPSGYALHKKGITPDVEVELDEALQKKAVITPEEDNQLQKAVEVLKEQEQGR